MRRGAAMANGQAEAGPPVGYGAADDADANGNEEDEGLRAPSGLQRFQGAGSTVVMALRVRTLRSGQLYCGRSVEGRKTSRRRSHAPCP